MTTQSNKGLQFWRYLRWLIFSPLIVIATVVTGLVCGYVYLDLALKGLFLKAQLARKHRVIGTNQVQLNSATNSEPGTLIIESYTLGWNVARIWWTSDTIPSPSVSIETETDHMANAVNSHQRDIYDKYADLQKGEALLLRVWCYPGTLKKIRNLLPNTPTINLWSGAILAERGLNLKGRSLLERKKGELILRQAQDDRVEVRPP